MANILTITAHPDDHLSCAGTLVKLKRSGHSLYEIVLTAGDEGFNRVSKTKLWARKGMKKIRLKEFDRASKYLGTKKTWCMGFEDLNVHYDKEIMFNMVKIIRKLKPMVVFFHNVFDYHNDHVQGGKISYEAINIAGSKIRPSLGESWRTPIVLTMEGIPTFETPAMLIDISDTYQEKIKVMEFYDSQKDSRMRRFLDGFALHRGALGRTQYAEAFNVYPNMPILIDFKTFNKLFG